MLPGIWMGFLALQQVFVIYLELSQHRAVVGEVHAKPDSHRPHLFGSPLALRPTEALSLFIDETLGRLLMVA